MNGATGEDYRNIQEGIVLRGNDIDTTVLYAGRWRHDDEWLIGVRPV